MSAEALVAILKEAGRPLTYRELHSMAKGRGLDVGEDHRPHLNWKWRELIAALKAMPGVRIISPPGLPLRIAWEGEALEPQMDSKAPPIVENHKAALALLIREEEKPKAKAEPREEEKPAQAPPPFPAPPSAILVDQIRGILQTLDKDKREIARFLEKTLIKIRALVLALNEPWEDIPPEFRKDTPSIPHSCGTMSDYFPLLDQWFCRKCGKFFAPPVPPLSQHRFRLALLEITDAIGAIQNLIIQLEEARQREAPVAIPEEKVRAAASEKKEERTEKISVLWGLITKYQRPSTPPARVLGEHEVESITANLKQVLPVLNKILDWFDKTVKRHMIFPRLRYEKDHLDLVNAVVKVGNFIIAGVSATVQYLQQMKDKSKYQLARAIMSSTFQAEKTTWLPRQFLSPEAIFGRPEMPPEEEVGE